MTPGLDAADRRAYDRMAADLRRVFGDRFVALVAGGHGASVAFASGIDAADLDALGALAETWHRDRVPTPLVMSPDEFHRSLDSFPAEFQAILDHHVVIDGVAPFAGARIDPDDLRRASEAAARGHLIHLRQGWIDGGSDQAALASLVERSAQPLRLVLSQVARLCGDAASDDAALASFASRTIGMPEDLVRAVLALDETPYTSDALVRRLPEYLTASEALWTFVDRWRAA